MTTFAFYYNFSIRQNETWNWIKKLLYMERIRWKIILFNMINNKDGLRGPILLDEMRRPFADHGGGSAGASGDDAGHD